MPQMNFPTLAKPLKILDAGDGGFVALQVLDASTLFFGQSLEELQADGIATAGAAVRSGFQLKAQAIPVPFVTWWKGEMWGRSDTVNGLIQAAIVYRKKNAGGDVSAPGFDEDI